jgi:hypothetical protein
LRESRPHLLENAFEFLEADWLFERADHVQPKSFAQTESRFENPPVETADYEHRCLAIFLGEETKKLDSIHTGHSEVERDHVGVFPPDNVAELLVVGSENGRKAAFLSDLSDEVGKGRLVIDHKEPRLTHSYSNSVSSRALRCGVND